MSVNFGSRLNSYARPEIVAGFVQDLVFSLLLNSSPRSCLAFSKFLAVTFNGDGTDLRRSLSAVRYFFFFFGDRPKTASFQMT